MQPVPPVFTLDLFPVLDQKLLQLLRSLRETDWQKPTLAPLWKVKDVAAHLLDGNLRGISTARDGYFGEVPEAVHSYADLVAFLNNLNATWVNAARRLSPAVLISLLEWSAAEYYAHLKTLSPFAKAVFPVGWAGEAESLNWFHIAREYTEKWHHQQQIRLAVGQEAELMRPELYRPFLDTCMRALPHHYRQAEAEPGTLLHFTVTGGLGNWYLLRTGTAWELVTEAATEPRSSVEIDQAIAWRLFMKGIRREETRAQVRITGDQRLGEKVLDMLSVMA